MKRYFLPAIIILVLVLFFSCYYDNQEALYPTINTICDTSNVTFSGTISPILTDNCTGCHSGSVPSGGITLTSITDVRTNASVGLLMNALTGNGVPKMPLIGSLSACKINQIQIWINKGMLNN